MKLNLKLFIPLLLIGLLAEGYLALIWYPNQMAQAEQRSLAKIENHLSSLGRSLLLAVLDNDFAAIYDTLDDTLTDNPYWKGIYLRNLDGTLLYPLHEEGTADDTLIHLEHAIDYLGERVATLSLDVDLNPEISTESQRLGQLLWLVLLAIVAFIAISGMLVEMLVRRPLATLADAADRLTNHDFSAPLPRASRDEVGLLVRSFGAMRDAIQDYQRQLRQQLEDRQRAAAIQRERSKILEQLATGSSLDQVLASLVDTLEGLYPESIGSICLLDETGRFLQRCVATKLPEAYLDALDGFEVGPGRGSCGTAAYTGERVVVEDVTQHPYWSKYQELAKLAGIRACWSEPIIDRGGRILGTFAIYHRHPNHPDAEQLDLIHTASRLAALAIEQRRTETALRQSHRRYRALYDDTPAMFLTVDSSGTILSVNRFGAAHLRYQVEELVGRPAADLYSESGWQQVKNHLQTCLDNPGAIQRWELPKVRKDGSTLWVRETARPAAGNGNTTLLIVSEDITEAHELSLKLRHQASHDALTGLYNRHEFEHRLSQALNQAKEEHQEHVLCYLDLDQFKIINDTCGHVAGDELLRQVARLAQQLIRKHDVLARLGGDEFGILLEQCTVEQAQRIAEELCQTLENYRFLWDDKSFSIGTSIGVVAIDANSTSLSSLLQAADTACYVAKDLGRNRAHLYREDDSALVERHREMAWVTRIEQALEEDNFRLWCQTIVATGESPSPLHYEVLLRLQDSDGKLAPPGVFLPAAERYQLSPRLDRWVIRKVLRWLDQHPEHLQALELCSINLSGLSVGDEKFHEFIIEQLASTRVPAHKLCFELTETAAIANLAAATEFIWTLREKGCRFALDDFGSGLSSFAYLKNLPVDFLKIDGMFVKDISRDPIDRAMVTAIHQIGTTMHKRTVAEFVEDQATLDCLKSIGVHYVQGYHLGYPQPLEDLLSQSLTV